MLALLLGSLAACGTAESADPADEVKSSITVPAGSRLRVSLLDGVSTTKSSPGDAFEASLVEPVVVDGKTILEKGAKVKGRVADVEESGRVKGRASLRLVLNSVVYNGDDIAIETKPFVAVAESTKGRDAAIIGGGAGVGAAIGAIAGGKKGAGVGAIVGGGAGTGTVLATKGKELHYPPETRLNFTLAAPIQIRG
jgi:hypothetical protein